MAQSQPVAAKLISHPLHDVDVQLQQDMDDVDRYPVFPDFAFVVEVEVHYPHFGFAAGCSAAEQTTPLIFCDNAGPAPGYRIGSVADLNIVAGIGRFTRLDVLVYDRLPTLTTRPEQSKRQLVEVDKAFQPPGCADT